MSIEENKAVVRRFIDAYDRRDAAAFREVAAPDLAKKAIDEWMPMNDARWADRTLQITEMVAEGDMVWASFASSARQIGEWMGVPATGKTAIGAGVGFMRVSGGKVVEFSTLWNDLNRVQQLGAKIVPAG